MNQRVRVQIDRSSGRDAGYDSFHGLVVAEATTHYKVQWVTQGWVSQEWFAKDGPRVQCTLLDEDLNPLEPLTA